MSPKEKSRSILLVVSSRDRYQALAPSGHRMDWASTFHEALTQWPEGRWDLLLLESGSAKGSHEWTDSFHRRGLRPPPVLLVCPADRVSEAVGQVALPVTDCLTAGFRPEELTARVEFLFTRRSAELRELKESFLDIMVYDLRAPLASIQVGMEFLRGAGRLPTAQHKVVETLYHGTTDLKDVLENYLGMERFEGGQELELKPADARDAALKALEAVKEYVAAKGIELQNNLAPGLPPVKADPEVLTRALRNVLLSAAKLSAKGSKLFVTANAAEGGVELGVSNETNTLSEEARQRAFDRFYHGGQGGWSFPRGFAASMAYSKAVFEAHGGTLRIEADPAGGNRFRMTLPAKK